MAGTSQTALPPRTNTADDKPTADEQELLHRLDDLYEEGEGVRDERRDPKDIESDLNLFRGDVGPSKKYMAANFIEAFIDRMVAQLTDNRPIIRVEAYKAGVHGVARAMNKVARTVWDDADMQRQAFKMAHSAAVAASAGLYTGYDPARDEITLETLRLDQVVIDPKIREAARVGHAADYVFIKRIVPLDELRVRFPGRGAAVEPDKRLSNLRVKKEGGKSVMSPVLDAARTFFGQQNDPVLPRAEITECWVRDWSRTADGKEMFPGGRLIIRSDDLVLWDGPNPYWDGQWPVDWYDWAVDPDHLWGRSEPARLRHLQLAFNQIGDGLVRNQLLSNVFTIVADFDAFPPEMWRKLQKLDDSLILRKQNRNAVVTPIPPPVFGADKLAIMKFMFTMAQLLAGVPDVTLGESPGSLQSGIAVEGLQESANLMTRARASRLEDLYKRVGQKLIARILQFYTSDRVVGIAGPSEDAVAYAKARQEMFYEIIDDKVEPVSSERRRRALNDMRFTVSPGSSAPGTRTSRAKLMSELFVVGLASGEDVLAAGDFPEPAEMIKRAQAERAKLAAAGIEPPKPSGK